MVTIQDYVKEKLEDTSSIGLANSLGVSLSMISAYKKSYNPSLSVAKTVYQLDGVTLHPFAEESLKVELAKQDQRN